MPMTLLLRLRLGTLVGALADDTRLKSVHGALEERLVPPVVLGRTGAAS